MSEVKPVDMLLFCPHCGEQHIDEPEPDKEWQNPPHRSHLCHFCKHVWRPADVPTNGVREIKTKGQNDKNPRPRYYETAKDFEEALANQQLRADQIKPFPPNCRDVWNHDAYHMHRSIDIGTNVALLLANHVSEPAKYIIVVNTDTGKRVKVLLDS